MKRRVMVLVFGSLFGVCFDRFSMALWERNQGDIANFAMCAAFFLGIALSIAVADE